MIRVNIKGIAYDVSGNPIILLTDEETQRVLPIWVGLLEAHSISVALEHINMPRPLTHDLLKTACDRLGASISRVLISDLHDNTFYAELHLNQGGQEIVIDARPSDAVALALRVNAPVFLNEKLTTQMLDLTELVSEKEASELENMLNATDEKKKLLH